MSIALDIPIQAHTQDVIDRLNAYVIACSGRIYLTKDGFTRPSDFRTMDPRVDRFLAVKRRWDPEGRLRSAQSERLFDALRAEPARLVPDTAPLTVHVDARGIEAPAATPTDEPESRRGDAS